MKRYNTDIKERVIKLRKNGKTYREIQKSLRVDVPKSTLSSWCSSVKLSKKHQDRIDKLILKNTHRARNKALEAKRIQRQKYLQQVRNRNLHLRKILRDRSVGKIILSTLYWGEGGKGAKRAAVMFGNSDPKMIELFVKLLRKCFELDESKFRCTVQCRADQNTETLEKYWANITGIPRNQFYKPAIDPRTVGKKSRNTSYEGVCKVEYFSADLFQELMSIAEIIYEGS